MQLPLVQLLVVVVLRPPQRLLKLRLRQFGSSSVVPGRAWAVPEVALAVALVVHTCTTSSLHHTGIRPCL
jgi:hypothetical protein